MKGAKLSQTELPLKALKLAHVLWCFEGLCLWKLLMSSPPVLLRYNGHITFCKFKVYNMTIWYMIYYKMIATISLVNIHPHTYLPFFLVMRTIKIFLSNFHIGTMVWFIVVTMLYVTSPEPIYFNNWKFVPSPISPIPNTCLWQPTNYSLFLWVCFLQIAHASEIIQHLSLSDLVHLA